MNRCRRPRSALRRRLFRPTVEPLASSAPRALALARQAALMAPNQSQCWVALASAWLRAGQPSEAAKALSQAETLRSDPTTAELLISAMTQWELGARDRARTLHAVACESIDSSDDRDPLFGRLDRLQAEAAELLSIPQ
jgi:predicted Zn-dependent protease